MYGLMDYDGLMSIAHPVFHVAYDAKRSYDLPCCLRIPVNSDHAIAAYVAYFAKTAYRIFFSACVGISKIALFRTYIFLAFLLETIG